MLSQIYSCSVPSITVQNCSGRSYVKPVMLVCNGTLPYYRGLGRFCEGSVLFITLVYCTGMLLQW